MEGENNPKKEKDLILPAAIVIAGIMIAGSVIYSTGVENTPGAAGGPSGNLGANLGADGVAEIEIGDDVILGDPNAKVTLVEYGDFQCPFCARFFSETEARIRKDYIESGKVRMVYKDFAFLGPESQAAAQAAECAKDQKKYWEYHDALFRTEIADGQENNGNLSTEKLKSLASELGLNRSQFDSCFDAGKYKDEVAKDYSDAQAIGVQATPTSFINGRRVQGALPYDAFKSILDEELSR